MRHVNRFEPLIRTVRRCLAALGVIATGVGHAATLTVEIENINSSDGTIMLAVNDQAAFAGEAEPAASAILPAREGAVTLVIDALPPGDYAIRVMHDENGNGELDANFVGMPKEPWGMSNNARGNFGPPKFEDAAFTLQEDVTLTIQLAK